MLIASPFLWVVFNRRRFPLCLEPLVLRLTTLNHWPSFSVVFRFPPYRSSSDWAPWARPLSVSSRLSIHQLRRVSQILRSMTSTKNLCSVRLLYRPPHLKFRSTSFWKKPDGASEPCSKIFTLSSALAITASVSNRLDRWFIIPA